MSSCLVLPKNTLLSLPSPLYQIYVLNKIDQIIAAISLQNKSNKEYSQILNPQLQELDQNQSRLKLGSETNLI